MSDDDWVKTAMEDDDLVADVLVRLHLASLQPPPPPPSKRRRPAPPQGWSVHQRRSRAQVLPPASAAKSETPRASPSTPLSWSGATSISGGAGAGVPIVDALESGQTNPNRSDISRSKVTPPRQTTPTKRPRKKKTLAALKEEEVVLMEEQKHLKRQLATLQATCEKQRKENESLKKMKLDIQVESQGERPEAVGSGGTLQPSSYFEAVNEQEDKIVLPDLNIPVGEDVIVS